MSIPASAQKVTGRLLKIHTYRVSPQQASFSAWLPALQYLLQLLVISERKRLGAVIDRHSNAAVGHVRSWEHCFEEVHNTAVLELEVANSHCYAMREVYSGRAQGSIKSKKVVCRRDSQRKWLRTGVGHIFGCWSHLSHSLITSLRVCGKIEPTFTGVS